MYLKKVFLAVSGFIMLHASGQGFLHAEGEKIVNGQNQQFILRGIGLGGWMLQEPYMLQVNGVAGTQHEIRAKIEQTIGKEKTEKFYEAWLSNHCTKADIDSLASWGFNSVRLPMHYNLFTPPIEEEKDSTKITWLKKGFALTDSLLKWCKANHIYLILDLHAAPGGQGNDNAISDRNPTRPSLWQSKANQQKTIALWKKLAGRYAKEQWIGGYDLINETNWGFEDLNDKNGCAEKQNTQLRSLLVAITKAIRSVDKNHLIFIEGNCWANNYSGMFPLWDQNMAVSFHKYWNNNDPAAIEKFLTIRKEQNVPLWMGESGENSNAWFTDAIRLLEEHQIGWAWWPLKKLGSNNPLQIKANADYRRLLDYWQGKEKNMTTGEAEHILMELAASLRTEKNLFHKDIVDAMFRQVHSAEAVAYKPHVLKDKLTIYASDYDLGRSNIAYHDNDSGNYWVSTQKRTSWNKGGQYRNDGVDIGICHDTLANGYAVGWTEEGEWMQYTITVPAKGWYTTHIRVKPGKETGMLAISSGEKLLGEQLEIRPAAAENWQTTSMKSVWLEEGVHQLRVKIIKGGFDLSYLQLLRASDTATTKGSQ